MADLGTIWLDRLELMLLIQDKVVDVEDVAIAAPGLLTTAINTPNRLARDHKSLAYRMLTLRRRCIVSIAPRSAMRGADSTIERPKCPLAHGHKRGSDFTCQTSVVSRLCHTREGSVLVSSG